MSEQQAKQPAHTVILGLLHKDVGRILEFIGMASRGIAVPTSGLFDANVRIGAFVDVFGKMVIPENAHQSIVDELKSLAEQLIVGLNSGIHDLRAAHNELVMLCSKLERKQTSPSTPIPAGSMPNASQMPTSGC